MGDGEINNTEDNDLFDVVDRTYKKITTTIEKVNIKIN